MQWCIMSNHVHLIASATEPNNLSDILRDLKKFTSTNIIKAILDNPKESRKSWILWIFKASPPAPLRERGELTFIFSPASILLG